MSDLFLLFRIDQEQYALAANAVVEVIPSVKLSKVHDPPPNIIGQFNYQGRIVPVLDVSKLLNGRESRSVLSTRIILVHLEQSTGKRLLLGLMAEQVTDTLRRDQTHPIDNHAPLIQPAYFSEVLLYEQAMLQCLAIDRLMAVESYDQVTLH